MKKILITITLAVIVFLVSVICNYVEDIRQVKQIMAGSIVSEMYAIKTNSEGFKRVENNHSLDVLIDDSLRRDGHLKLPIRTYETIVDRQLHLSRIVDDYFMLLMSVKQRKNPIEYVDYIITASEYISRCVDDDIFNMNVNYIKYLEKMDKKYKNEVYDEYELFRYEKLGAFMMDGKKGDY